ncbi:MAG: hypothetical protein FJX76_27040 [Armatimonadetes bacterium]|nr:hypothetical protein [Armatimonadota bacterium]
MSDIEGAVPPTFAEKDLNYYLRMIRGDFAELEEQEPQMARIGGGPAQKNIVILVSKKSLGTGSNEVLGERLLRHFFKAVVNNRVKPRAIILMNEAVSLAAEDGDVLHKLIVLEEQGIKIMVCVISVDELGIEEQLKVGSVADMDAICEHLLSAWKVITL